MADAVTPLTGPCTFAPQPSIPSTDTVWIEDEWTTLSAWPVDTSQRASGTASFPDGSLNAMGIRELEAIFPEPPLLDTSQSIVAYILISNCDPSPTAFGIEVSWEAYVGEMPLSGAPLRYYWGHQTLWQPDWAEPPVRLGDVPPAGRWIRLEMNAGGFQGLQPYVTGLRLLSDDNPHNSSRIWWDHIGNGSLQLSLNEVVPRYGAAAGGTAVRLLGTGFTDGPTTIRFGAAAATSVVFVSTTELTAISPAGTGTVDVEVTTSLGVTVLADAFTYVEAPTLTTVSPSKTSIAGNEMVVIDGTNFVAGVTAVAFGLVEATSVNVISSTRIEAVAPPQAAGAVDVTVTTPGGNATIPAAFSYFAVPVIDGFSPAQGNAGAAIEIAGHGFDPDPSGNAVSIGSVVAPVVSASATRLVVSVPAGATTGRVSVTTAGGTAVSATDFVVVAYDHIVVLPGSISVFVGETTMLSAAGVLADGSTQTLTSGVTWTSANGSIASVDTNGVVHGITAGTALITATAGTFSASATVTVTNAPPLPPDPATVASPLSSTELTSFVDSTSFLYSGANPIQTGVAPGTIEPLRAGVTRGIVRTRDGQAIRGVTARILDHPEFGETLTRADGRFDLVVNGGTTYALTFEKSGYVPAQRRVYTRWQDFALVEDVVMIGYDAAATAITAGSATIQVARGSAVTDEDGQRRATLLVPAGTGASLTLPDGSTRTIDQLTLRMTEYTVGPNGPSAMPAPLPPESGYTYCVELSADEAIRDGASSVSFTRPLAFYVENFLGFPAGGEVPSGYYDRQRGAWIPSTNGRVVAIVGITSGKADLDISGDGIADDPATLAALGMDDAEREGLAALYSTGTSLWRVPVEHFSPYDLNWPQVATDENAVPPSDPPEWSEQPDDPAKCSGSVVRCETQTLGERVPIAGTPFDLVYESGRVRGRATNRSFKLTLSGPRTPSSVRRIEVRIEAAGNVTERAFASGTATMDFTWDGRDVYGRLMTGATDARVSVSYFYDAVYQDPLAQRWFAMRSGTALGVPTRQEIRMSSEWSVPVGSLHSEMAHLGGWTLTSHHLFDYSRRTLLLGNGEQRSADIRDLRKYEMTNVAGTVQCCGDSSGVATRTRLDAAYQVAVGPDGSIYTNEQKVIRRITPSGSIERIAGTGTAGFSGDGGPATAAKINAYRTITIAPNGSLYFPDRQNYRVRRIRNGIITTVAGNGEYLGSGALRVENIPATQSAINPQDVAVAADGTLYVADDYRYIRRITPDGIIQTVVGGGTLREDGTPARDFRTTNIEAFALAPDGSFYFAEPGIYGAVLRRVGTDGIVRTVVASGPHCVSNTTPNDGGPAYSACLNKIWFLRTGPDGSIYLPDQIGDRVRMISPDGIIRTIAGTGQSGDVGRSGVATGESVVQPFGAAVGPDGSVYVSDLAGDLIRRVTSSLPRFKTGETIIPSADGNQLFVFSGSRHLETLDAVTGAALLRFGYDTAGRLVSITDFDDKITTIERSGDAISAIVAPGGQRTSISVDSNGYLNTVTDPAGRSYTLIHTDTGLLTELRTPRLLTHHYTYDEDGRLERDLSPDGRSLTLTRSGSGDNWSVTTTTSLGLTMTKQRHRNDDGSGQRVSLLPGGLSVQEAIGSSGATVVTSPDGVVATSTPKGDPRFAANAPLLSEQLRFPSGLTATSTHNRTVTLSNPDDILSMTMLTDTFNLNGRVTTAAYDTALRQLRITTPAGRTSLISTDDARRPRAIETPGLAQVQIGYADGLLTSISAGSRLHSSFQYDAKRRLQSVTDSLSRTVSFGYDDADRVISQTLSDGRVIGFGYDAAGNLTSVTPPSRPAHAMTFTFGDQLASYHAPPVAGVANITRYVYDADRKLKTITRPDSSTITFSHDANGRVSGLTAADATIGVTWDSAGRLGTLTAPSGTLTYAYDGSLLTGATLAGDVAGTVGYTYDNGLRVTGESVNGAAVSFGWDADDLLIQVGALTLARQSNNGLLSGTTLGAITDAFMYNEFGEVIAYAAEYAGSPVYAVSYSRDNTGRITGTNETALGATVNRGYEYDAAGRLERVTSGGAPLAVYGYDGNSNRVTHQRVAATDAGVYDEQDRLIAYGDATYTFTANGDLQAMNLAGATTTYNYDAFGNLTSVGIPGGTTIQYVVDAQNRRIGKKVNGNTVAGWLYADQLRIIAELAPDGAVASRFVYGTRSNVPSYMIRGGVTYRILSDHLGSPRLVMKAADGTAAQRIDYDEFGNVLSDTNPGFQPFGFAGGLYDADTHLVRFGARDYNPHTGRWLAKDPSRFAGGLSNLYGYVGNDPMNFVDPSGRAKKSASQMNCAELEKKINAHAEALAKLLNDEKQLQAQGKGQEAYAGHKEKWDNQQRGLDDAYEEWHDRCFDDDDPKSGKLARRAERWLDESYPLPLITQAQREQMTRDLLIIGGAAVIAATLIEDLGTGGLGILDDPLTIGIGISMIAKGLQ